MLEKICPTIVKKEEELYNDFLEDSLTVSWALAGSRDFINKVLENRNVEKTDIGRRGMIEHFIGDVIVSLTGNKLLMNKYVENRREQYRNILESISDDDLINIGKEMNLKISSTGTKFGMPFFEYLSLIEKEEDKALHPVNNTVVGGDVRINKSKLINALAGGLSVRLSKKLPLSISGDYPNEIDKEADEVSEIAKEKGMEFLPAGPSELNRDLFPPCIKTAMQGVEKGERNFIISVVLPSFLSHARFMPDEEDAKIEDYVGDVDVALEEFLPLIEEAAKNCSPPLFKDQPNERKNVLTTLGLTKDKETDPTGQWYMPPNCDRIENNSSICNPNSFCDNIKNPLTYYMKKVSNKRKSEEK